MGKLSFPPVLQPAKKSYRLNELVDGRYYRCILSGKVVRYNNGSIVYFNDIRGVYMECFDLFDFQLEDL